MFNPADMAERHARILAELSELGLGFARQAAADAAAAETPEARAQQALVFQRVSRSVRQSVALEAKLVRDARRDAAAEQQETAKRRRGEAIDRQWKLREKVEALIWDETETMDAEEEEAFGDEIYAAVQAEAEAETFLDEPIADQVARVLTALGFEIGPDGDARRIPEPGPEPMAEPAWHGSG
jgi:hypothetical protein